MGPYKTLTTFSPLLKRKSQNPHATLLALFLNAMHETKLSDPGLCSMESEMKQLTRYMKPTIALLQKTKYITAEQVKHTEALAIFTNYDALFKRFMEDCCFKEIALMSGLEMREKYSCGEVTHEIAKRCYSSGN
jgi:flagellar biosynthesis regulator FlaF